MLKKLFLSLNYVTYTRMPKKKNPQNYAGTKAAAKAI